MDPQCKKIVNMAAKIISVKKNMIVLTMNGLDVLKVETYCAINMTLFFVSLLYFSCVLIV